MRGFVLDFSRPRGILIVYPMMTRIQKWGNSLGLRIPKAFAEEARVGAGSEVDLAIERDRLVIRPLRKSQYQLRVLLRGVTTSNLHAEVDAGRPLGREPW